jgi:hypothetical protein
LFSHAEPRPKIIISHEHKRGTCEKGKPGGRGKKERVLGVNMTKINI